MSRPMGNDAQQGKERRNFLKLAIGFVTAVNGLVLGIPFIGNLLNSPPVKKSPWSRVGSVSSLATEQPTDMKFKALVNDAFYHMRAVHSVWVIKDSSGDFTVFSPICPHMGCHYKWDPKTGHFECPCHGSVFTITGKVIGGPAPRPLDTLPKKIENGVLYVRWERFEVGTSKKIVIAG
jgi:menaquinol-cytochrome c reductase iron-sulfur subunit